MIMKSTKRISPLDELALLLKEGWMVLIGETRNLIISLCFPIGAAIVIVWIAGKDMFVNSNATNNACFILVCASIWGGLFNSIQVVVKERANIKRDYVSGALRIECYTISRSIIQLGLCALQSLLLSLATVGVVICYDVEMQSEGILLGSTFIEYWVSLFLITFAADTMGLMISCIVKSEQLASQLSPYILILQLLFSGVIFSMEGAASAVSSLMLSKWGMAALGTTSNLNALPLKFAALEATRELDDAFEYEGSHMITVWLILLAFCVVPLIIGDIMLYRVSKDSRG